MLKFIFSFLFLVVTSLSSQGRSSIGCVPTSNPTKIYTTLVSDITYSSTGFTFNLGAGCSWIYYTNPSYSCTVNNGIGSGFKGVDTPQYCPIDDYVWLILIIFGGLGYVYVRQKKTSFKF